MQGGIKILTIIKSITLIGLNGYKVDVQVDVSNNMPKWEIIGLPDNSIRESKERVKAAIKNSGYELRSKKILVNLAPAEIKKEGSAFDLAIAIGILNNIGYIQNDQIDEYAILGELSLNGKVNEILPKGNIKEATILKELQTYGVENLKEAVEFLNGQIKIENNIEIEKQKKEISQIDFSEVKGQENVKRALEIAAAGGHNCLMIGSPGSGKTMLAQRISSILPDMNFEESLEVTKIHSIAGMTKK